VVDVRPSAEALILPEGYGTVRRTLAWPTVRERLEQALHYWVATTRIDGRPHVVPRWGVWVDDAWYYDGSPATVNARKLERNAAAVLHLEDGARAVVVEGASHPLRPPGGMGERLAAAFEKYHALGYAPEPTAWDGGGLWCLRPRQVLAWTDFPADATRFRVA
jgi:hypothetical protein